MSSSPLLPPSSPVASACSSSSSHSFSIMPTGSNSGSTPTTPTMLTPTISDRDRDHQQYYPYHRQEDKAIFKWNDDTEAMFLASFMMTNKDKGKKGGAFFLRPIGPHKHISMLLAYTRFTKKLQSYYSKQTPPVIDIDMLWAKLEELFDLDLAERENRDRWQKEGIFSKEEKEFQLPEEFFVEREKEGRKKKNSLTSISNPLIDKVSSRSRTSSPVLQRFRKN